MKQARKYFEKLLGKDLAIIEKVGSRVKEYRREIDRIEYKALKFAFLIRVSEGAVAHIRMMIEDFDHNIGAWQKFDSSVQKNPIFPQVHLDKIEMLNKAKELIELSGVESKLSNSTSIAEARDALDLALKLVLQLEELLKPDKYLSQ